jgi:hypothetical protein
MMKRLLVTLGWMAWLGVPGADIETLSAEVHDRPSSADTLMAHRDFTIEVPGFAPYYIEENRDGHASIGINSVEYEGEYAAADHLWTGASGVYEVTIGIRPEFDGECVYILYINGTAQRLTVAMKTEVPIGPPTPHTWTDVAINTGDTIRISSNNATNGLLPEGEGTGFSRGRWSWLLLTPSR